MRRIGLERLLIPVLAFVVSAFSIIYDSFLNHYILRSSLRN
jgi:hypothetical protein